VASALGFGVAYYFDAQNGGLRRKRLEHKVQAVVGRLNARMTPDVDDPPVVFHPVFRSHRMPATVPGAGEQISAVR
jgi:hypothetical protein